MSNTLPPPPRPMPVTGKPDRSEQPATTPPMNLKAGVTTTGNDMCINRKGK